MPRYLKIAAAQPQHDADLLQPVTEKEPHR